MQSSDSWRLVHFSSFRSLHLHLLRPGRPVQARQPSQTRPGKASPGKPAGAANHLVSQSICQSASQPIQPAESSSPIGQPPGHASHAGQNGQPVSVLSVRLAFLHYSLRITGHSNLDESSSNCHHAVIIRPSRSHRFQAFHHHSLSAVELVALAVVLPCVRARV